MSANLKGTCRHFAKQRHTIMLLRHCVARPYATYGYRSHRRHIQGLPSYSERAYVPPYSQNAGAVSTYVTVWRLIAYHVSQRIALPGVNMFAHLSVIGILWNRLRSLGAALCALLILKALYAVNKHSYLLPAIIRTSVRYGKR